MKMEIKSDKDFIEAFNQGYELASELGLKPDILKGINAGKGRIEALKEGMIQHQKELSKNKSKDTNIIPPLDLDSLDLPPKKFGEDIEENQDKDKDLDIDL